MKHIIKRELQDTIKSLHFIVLLIVSMGLFSLNGGFFVHRINKQVKSFNEKTAENYPWPSTVVTNLYKQPSPLMFIAEGGDKYRPEGCSLRPGGQIYSLPPVSSNYNYKMPDLPVLDWAFIIKVIFSLYVLLIGHNAVSGEKERGTLGLIFSNPLNRIELLVAKYLSVLVLVLVPLLLGMLMSLITIEIFIPQISAISSFIRFITLFAIAFSYLSLFIFLGLFISSLTHNSSLALLLLLAIWLIFIIIPELSFSVSQKFAGVPGEYQVARLVNESRHTESGGYREFYSRVQSGEFKNENEVREAGTRMITQLQKNLNKLYREYENSMINRAKTARLIARFSPLSLLQFSLESIAGTGVKRLEHFLTDVENFSIVYDNYVIEKVGKVVPYLTFGMGWHVNFNGKWIEIRTPVPEQYDGDTSDFPKFVSEGPSMNQSVRDALPDIMGLLLWNIILALLAFAAFMRYDVR